MTTEEGNKVIADFMGWEIKPYTMDEPPYTHYPQFAWHEGLPIFTPDGLPYHKSWDLLIPVCKKLYDIWIPNFKEDRKLAELFEDVWTGMWHFDITECFEAAVNLIQYHNQNK